MGRTKQNKKGARGGQVPPAAAAGPSSSAAAGSSDISAQVDDLLSKAHTLVAQQNYETAVQFLSRLLQLAPSHLEGRELLGVCELEQGNIQAAYEHFTALTEGPQPSPSAHLYLAQLAPTPPIALSNYERSIPLLEVQLAELVNLRQELPDGPAGEAAEVVAAREECERGEDELRKQMCRALVGMTEIYLTDLCMEPGAEDKCLLFLQKALSLCPSDPEAWLTLASVRLSQSSPLEALACLSRAWAPWRSLAPGSLALPPSATRLAVARLMAELGLGRQALEVLGGVRDEDDEDVEAAYLEGWIWYLRGSGELPAIFSGDEAEMEGLRLPPPAEGEEVEPEPTKVECWEEARESLTVCVLLHQAQQHPTAEILEHATELLQTLDQAGIRPAEGVVDEEDLEGAVGEDALDWADDDDDEDMED